MVGKVLSTTTSPRRFPSTASPILRIRSVTRCSRTRRSMNSINRSTGETEMDHNENPKQRPSSAEHAKRRASFFAEWMSKLSAAYRQEIPMPTQAMYLDALSDLPLDRLEQAVQRAVRERKFLPSIAEIRELECEVEVPRERLEAAYERLKHRQLTGEPPK